MYDEFKTNCEEMITAIEAVTADLVTGGSYNDVKAEALHKACAAAARELHNVISTIDAYYAE